MFDMLVIQLSYLTGDTNDYIQKVVDAKVVPAIVAFLDRPATSSVLVPALRTAGNIATGTDEQTQAVLNAGLLRHLPRVLLNPKVNIR